MATVKPKPAAPATGISKALLRDVKADAERRENTPTVPFGQPRRILGRESNERTPLLTERRKPTQDDIRDRLAQDWVIYYDPGTKTYYRGRVNDSSPFALEPFDERSPFLNEALSELERGGLVTDKRKLIESVFNKDCYHEVNYVIAQLDYLGTEWDGQDYVSQLLKSVGTDDDALFAATLKRWLVNVVAQVYGSTGADRNDYALVLVSHEQGTGKTSFFEGLLWDDKHFANVPTFSFDNKEHRLLMAAKVLILLDEMGQYKKADVETLKAGFSQTKITADAKYKSTEDYKRIGSFAGCSNNDNFLKDDTGDRRFLVFRLLNFNREKYAAVPKKQLWGQLARLYKEGFTFHQTKEEIAAVVERNSENFTMQKPEDSFISDCLNITKNPEDFISAVEMQKQIDRYKYNSKGQSFLNIQVVRAKLQKLGVDTSVRKRMNGPQVRCYTGVEFKVWS